MSGLVVGLDVEHLDERRADHDLRQLVGALPDGTVRAAATHWATLGERPHVALSVELVGLPASAVLPLLGARLGQVPSRWSLAVGGEVLGDDVLRGAAAAARDAHVHRRSGRVVRFPGGEELVGALTVRALLDRSAVERVRVLAAGDAPPDAVVRTRDHVRPVWADGSLVLLVQPAVGGTLVPFESPDPTACCTDH